MRKSWVCLMYHDVVSVAPVATGASGFFTVSSRSFARQLALIRDAGVQGCSIAAALASRDSPRVGISFDDGNLGQATRAFPTLVANGMTATFFVTTGWIGRPGYASWDQLRDMRAAGMSIESHTHTHPFLSELGEENLRDELRRSRDLLAEHLHEERPRMLALPGGDAPRQSLRRLLAEEGYAVIATSRWGINDARSSTVPRYVQRCTIRGELSDQQFLAIVHGDLWLRMRKRARESTLAVLRRSLGPKRYARWRRELLDAAGRRRLGMVA